jgi:hypothetical protein
MIHKAIVHGQRVAAVNLWPIFLSLNYFANAGFEVLPFNSYENAGALSAQGGVGRLCCRVGGPASIENAAGENKSFDDSDYYDYSSKYIEAIRIKGNRDLYLQIGFIIFVIITGGFCGLWGLMLIESGDREMGLVFVVGSFFGIIAAVVMVALGYNG